MRSARDVGLDSIDSYFPRLPFTRQEANAVMGLVSEGEAMKALGYVQRFGLGIPIARRELQKNGNPPPEFTVEPTSVLVTVRPRP